jgi:hypothetical protein
VPVYRLFPRIQETSNGYNADTWRNFAITLITASRWALSVMAFHEKTTRVLLWDH